MMLIIIGEIITIMSSITMQRRHRMTLRLFQCVRRVSKAFLKTTHSREFDRSSRLLQTRNDITEEQAGSAQHRTRSHGHDGWQDKRKKIYRAREQSEWILSTRYSSGRRLRADGSPKRDRAKVARGTEGWGGVGQEGREEVAGVAGK